VVSPASLTIIGNTTTTSYTGNTRVNTFSVSGLLNGDAVTSVSGLATGTNVGTYNDHLTNATGSGLSNYAISYINGLLTIQTRILLEPASPSGDFGGYIRVVVDKIVVNPIKVSATDAALPELTIEAKPETKPDAKPEVKQPTPEGNGGNVTPKDTKDNTEVTHEEPSHKRAAPITPEIIKLLNMYVSVPDGCNAHDDSVHYVPGKTNVVPLKPSIQQKPSKTVPSKEKQKEQDDQNAAFNDIDELMVAA
jgi:hypothetical protein